MHTSPEPESFSDDPASQQLLLEAHTPRPKPIPSFNDSVVRSAHLLNAARADKLTATAPPATKLSGSRKTSNADSARGSMAPRNSTGKLGKLKRPTLLAADLAKLKHPGAAKRRDIYAIPDSPTKPGEGEVILPQAVNRKPLKVVRDKSKKAKSPEVSVELDRLEMESPDLSALEATIPELTPELAAPELVSDVHDPEEQEHGTQMIPESSMLEPRSSPPLMSTEAHASTTINLLLPNGQPRCTGINLSDKSGNKGKQCLHKGTTTTDSGWRCAHHRNYRHSELHLDSTMENTKPRVSKGRAANLPSSLPIESPGPAVSASMPISSPPKPSSALVNPVVLELHLPNGSFRCQGLHSSQTAISRGTFGQQCSKSGTVETDDGWRCQSHGKMYLKGIDRHSIGRVTGEGADVAEVDRDNEPKDSRRTMSKESPKRKADLAQLENGKAPKSPRIQKANPHIVTEVDVPIINEHDRSQDRESDPMVVIPGRKSSRQAKLASHGTIDEEAEPQIQGEETLIVEDGEEVPNIIGHQEEIPTEDVAQKPAKKARKKGGKKSVARPPRPSTEQKSSQAAKSKGGVLAGQLSPSKRTQKPGKASRSAQTMQTEIEAEEEGFIQTGQGSIVEEEQVDEEDEEDEKDEANQLTELDRVFKFLDCDKRDGDCQTTEGSEIHKACHSACALIVDNEIGLQEISDTADTIKRKLTIARSIPEEERETFKVDAYGYLFRSLTRFLEAVHDWAVHNTDTVDHLSILRLVTPLVRDIISFKDTLASWSPFHRRYREDRNIKQVEQKLIVPLRKVAEAYRVELKQLEHVEKNRRKREELFTLRQEREQEEERKAEAQRVYRKKAKIWQYLETARLMCEPDPSRRRMLIPPKRENTGERDANGVEFDRVPLFLPRETPPPLAPNIALKAWTKEESTALAEALQRFAGMCE
jgi:hypothetical protein